MVTVMNNSDEKIIVTEYSDRAKLTGDAEKDLLTGIGEYWGCFYLANPHRFAMDYLGYNLHIFQQVLLYFMFKSDVFVFIASRGQLTN